VNQVLNPCSDISAIMAEVANIPSPCKSNLEYGLMKAGLSSWHALLLATGLSRKMYTSGGGQGQEGWRNFAWFEGQQGGQQEVQGSSSTACSSSSQQQVEGQAHTALSAAVTATGTRKGG
jgi:hypothetical protein